MLLDWRSGNKEALSQLMPVVYDELRRIAAQYMRRERVQHTLQPTALVNEAYLRLVGMKISWQGRAHFFAVAARLMRRLLVDHARANACDKRGQDGPKVSLDDAAVLSEERAAELVALDEALDTLAELDARKARVVELRYFGGLSVEETAEVLGVHPNTVTREWGQAKAFLHRELHKDEV